MANQPSRSETNLLDGENMEVEPLNDSVTQINLSGILNKTIQPQAQQDSPVDEGPTQIASFLETRGKRLKAALIVIAKASHHKAFYGNLPDKKFTAKKHVFVGATPHLPLESGNGKTVEGHPP